MTFFTLFPLGLLQLYESVNHGYYEARTLSFLTNPTAGRCRVHRRGRATLLWLCWRGVRERVPYVRLPASDHEMSTVSLFTEVTEPGLSPDEGKLR